MNRILKLSIAILLLMSSTTQSARSIIDMDDVARLLEKKHPQEVIIVNYQDSPVIIKSATIEDLGSARFKNFQGVFNTYQATVKNQTNRRVLSYQLKWILKHPFKNYAEKVIVVNNIDTLGPKADQSILFRTDKYYRDDAFYFVEISKVQFDDETIWEVDPSSYTIYGLIKQKIQSIKEADASKLSKEELAKLQADGIISGATANGVSLDANGNALNLDHKTTTALEILQEAEKAAEQILKDAESAIEKKLHQAEVDGERQLHDTESSIQNELRDVEKTLETEVIK